MNNLKYQVYLTEANGNYVQLDCEDLDMQTIFQINDVADITAKKDSISKNVTFKGTKNNTITLGNLFNLSRYVTPTGTTQLKSQTSFARKYECVILEDSVIIMKGYLKYLNTKRQPNGDLAYECLVTGNIVFFYNLFTDDMMLSDLDFSEYKHQFSRENIQNSWDTSITKNGTSIPFQLGSGYLYPFINYGDLSSPQASDVNKIHINNFRAAIYFREYINKIFALPILNGFTYEILGNDDFIADQNCLIIPCDQKVPIITTTGTTLSLTNTTTIPKDLWSSEFNTSSTRTLSRTLWFNTIVDAADLVSENTSAINGDVNNVFTFGRELNTGIAISFNANMTNNNSNSVSAYARLLLSGDGGASYSTIGESFITTLGGNTSQNKAASLIIAPRDYEKDHRIKVVLVLIGDTSIDYSTKFNLTITNAKLVAPSVSGSSISYNIRNGDMVSPQPVSNIKIKDFIKSWTQQFNIYTYSKMDNPKHIFFQSYPDFYSNSTTLNLKSNAVDWTKKLDYSYEIGLSAYANISKKYTFVTKLDTDYYNNLYNKTYADTYGNYTETDNQDATNDEKKIELTFSATPLISYNGTGRLNPEIMTIDDSGNRGTLKTNIRLMYYNGLKSCIGWEMGNMSVDGNGNYNLTAYTAPSYSGTVITSYPQVGHLRLADGLSNMTYLRDLNFGVAREYYFTAAPNIQTIPNSYTTFYQPQIKETNDLNVNLFDGDFILTPQDINNLDMSVPIFINSPWGNSYYKIQKIEYNNRFEPSSVQLQMIISQ